MILYLNRISMHLLKNARDWMKMDAIQATLREYYFPSGISGCLPMRELTRYYDCCYDCFFVSRNGMLPTYGLG